MSLISNRNRPSYLKWSLTGDSLKYDIQNMIHCVARTVNVHLQKPMAIGEDGNMLKSY